VIARGSGGLDVGELPAAAREQAQALLEHGAGDRCRRDEVHLQVALLPADHGRRIDRAQCGIDGIGIGLLHAPAFEQVLTAQRLLQFLREVKSGVPCVAAPVYSHVVYDIIPGETVSVCQPDILILEGLNVLQVGAIESASEFVSDYFDFSIYVDADERDIEEWYVQRFLRLRDTVFQNPDSFFRHYAALDEAQAIEVARGIWHGINGKNLKENIEPTKRRASLLLHKGADHRVTSVALRRL